MTLHSLLHIKFERTFYTFYKDFIYDLKMIVFIMKADKRASSSLDASDQQSPPPMDIWREGEGERGREESEEKKGWRQSSGGQ